MLSLSLSHHPQYIPSISTSFSPCFSPSCYVPLILFLSALFPYPPLPLQKASGKPSFTRKTNFQETTSQSSILEDSLVFTVINLPTSLASPQPTYAIYKKGKILPAQTQYIFGCFVVLLLTWLRKETGGMLERPNNANFQQSKP